MLRSGALPGAAGSVALRRLMSTAAAAGAGGSAPPASTAPAGPTVAIVGGGIAGLTCASALAEQGYRVTVFDMGRTHPGARWCRARCLPAAPPSLVPRTHSTPCHTRRSL
jgi:heterodisulfide reductase subunit A-like polyferredoxin